MTQCSGSGFHYVQKILDVLFQDMEQHFLIEVDYE